MITLRFLYFGVFRNLRIWAMSISIGILKLCASSITRTCGMFPLNWRSSSRASVWIESSLVSCELAPSPVLYPTVAFSCERSCLNPSFPLYLGPSSPRWQRSSCEIRLAISMVARIRGCVTTIFNHGYISRSIWGTWVDFPLPVSACMITISWLSIASWIVLLERVTGRLATLSITSTRSWALIYSSDRVRRFPCISSHISITVPSGVTYFPWLSGKSNEPHCCEYQCIDYWKISMTLT